MDLWGQAQGCRQLTQLFPSQHFRPRRAGFPGRSLPQRRTDGHGRGAALSRPRVRRPVADTCLPALTGPALTRPALTQPCRRTAGSPSPGQDYGSVSRVWGGREQPARDRPYPGPIFLRAVACTRGDGGSALLFLGIPWRCFLQTPPKLLCFPSAVWCYPAFPSFAVFNEAHAVKSPPQPELYCFAVSKGTGRNGNN